MKGPQSRRRRSQRRKTRRIQLGGVIQECVDISQAKTVADAKNIYKKASLKYHPDKPGGKTELFQELGNCFETRSLRGDSPAPPPAAPASSAQADYPPPVPDGYVATPDQSYVDFQTAA